MATHFASPLPLPSLLAAFQRIDFPRKLGLCEGLFGRALARHGIAWVRTAAGPCWKLDLANPTHRWIVYGDYEGTALWNWLRRRRSLVTTILDSGANIGQTTLGFAALLPAARIFAYEPGAAARAWLAECIAANRLSQVTVISAGLGAVAKLARLSDESNDERHGSWNKVNENHGETISILTLDEELRRQKLERLDFWKLDMEGYEVEALRGAAGALSVGRIGAIYVEVGGEAGESALTYLRSHRYTVHALTTAGRLVEWQHGKSYDMALCLPPGADDSP